MCTCTYHSYFHALLILYYTAVHVRVCHYFTLPNLLTGSPLMPDYFLDEAEQFMDQWTSGNQSSSSPGSSVGGVFEKVRSFISPEIVKSVQATYKFSVTGDEPGQWWSVSMAQW